MCHWAQPQKYMELYCVGWSQLCFTCFNDNSCSLSLQGQANFKPNRICPKAVLWNISEAPHRLSTFSPSFCQSENKPRWKQLLISCLTCCSSTPMVVQWTFVLLIKEVFVACPDYSFFLLFNLIHFTALLMGCCVLFGIGAEKVPISPYCCTDIKKTHSL